MLRHKTSRTRKAFTAPHQFALGRTSSCSAQTSASRKNMSEAQRLEGFGRAALSSSRSHCSDLNRRHRSPLGHDNNKQNKTFSKPSANTAAKYRTWPPFPGVHSTPGPPAAPAFLARFLYKKFLSSRCTCSSSSSRSTPLSDPAFDPPRDARSPAAAASAAPLLRPPARLPRKGDVSALGGLLSSGAGRLR